MDEQIRKNAIDESESKGSDLTFLIFKDEESGDVIHDVSGVDIPIPSAGEVVFGGVANNSGANRTTETYVVTERIFGYYDMEPQGEFEGVMTQVTLWVTPNQ